MNMEGLTPEFAAALEKFIGAAPGTITVNSGYRSPERQAELWAAALEKYGSPEAARKWVAPPGRSQHNFGRAVDLGYASPEVEAWAHENAATYGLNYPMSWEPWHIEPIGARGGEMAANGMGAAAQKSPVSGDIGGKNVLAAGAELAPVDARQNALLAMQMFDRMRGEQRQNALQLPYQMV